MSDDHELETVRAQVRDGSLFSPAVTAQIDALRASVHAQLRERGIDPASPECERMWLVAGGVVGRLLASPETIAVLAGPERRPAARQVRRAADVVRRRLPAPR